MRNVLGLPLATAVALLTADGYAVETAETRSRKGTEGADLRVLRQREHDGTVNILYAAFTTTLQKEPSATGEM